ncbi:trimeric intracellular cation channel family protein [Desulfosarcina sp.]|uniref:trimeric intracellular cation channel family protein n=1 Tax=Desulfosarcina sp. TaxID=2027861 RepID=UPI00299FAB2A|nr:TRIC cation channel family protein [Desulfosarcina sp.]MDX2492973.1 TRIC cation channel family protein [Desulfosarcina sp.]
MPPANDPLSASILAIMYFGDVVFAVSGALNAARRRMDVMGFVLIGTITGIGGGTLRDLLLGRTVWWTQDPLELLLCVAAALLTFLFIKVDITQDKWMVWSDALGLACFGVVGCHTALAFGAPVFIAVFLGMVTATGGGVIRDTLTQTQPMILCGEVYATAALAGSLGYALLVQLALPEGIAEFTAVLLAFSIRAAAIIFNIQMGPPGEFIRIKGRNKQKNNQKEK